ncbi:MAG: catalase [Pseudomonadota bacterium]
MKNTFIISILSSMLFSSHAVMAAESNTSVNTVNAFEQLFGVMEGKRRNHVRGFCFAGELTPVDGKITQYSKSAMFTGKSSVIGRLSHKDGYHSAPDNKPAHYGMGLSIQTSSGETHLMSMNTLDFFPVATPEAFAELMQAKVTGGPAVKAFKSKNKDLQRFKAHAAKNKKTLTPYEGTTYNSVNSFYLVNEQDEQTAIRWSFVPVQPQNIVLEPTESFFFENMQKNLSQHDISWDMVITIANPDDAVNNAALPWEGEHQQLTAARLKVLSIAKEEDGQCDNINYDPLVLSSGFKPSDDPLLQARSTSYAITFGKRLSEKSTQ